MARGGYGSVDYFMGLVVKGQNDWHDTGRPSSCNASHLLFFSNFLFLYDKQHCH